LIIVVNYWTPSELDDYEPKLSIETELPFLSNGLVAIDCGELVRPVVFNYMMLVFEEKLRDID